MNPYTIQGDCIEVMYELIRRRLTVQSIVTDNPYGIGFLNKDWDNPDNISLRPEVWRLCYHLLPPGGHLLAFGSPRTYHLIASAIADAGFEIRDQIQWVYGQGFPKSLDVAKSIDRISRGATAWGGGDPEAPNYRLYEGMGDNGYRTADGIFNTQAAREAAREFVRKNPNVLDASKNAEHHKRWQQGYTGNADIVPIVSPEARQWEGWQSNLKPAVESIVLARKPVEGSIARNVLKYGTGALNIDGCRVPGENPSIARRNFARRSGISPGHPGEYDPDKIVNRITPERYRSDHPGEELGRWPANFIHDGSEEVIELLGDKARFFQCCPWSEEDAARLFYCPKVRPKDRNGSGHPTMKPLALMQYLVRLVTPPGGLVLDPFAGTGTTGEAAHLEGFDYLLIEREPEFVKDIERRLGKYYNRSA